MTFTVHIDEVLDGRPNGTVTYGTNDDTLGFDGWVALLRILEEHTEAARTDTTEVTTDTDHGGHR